MNKFLFKSTAADLSKTLSIIDNKLDILQKNTLYLTYRIDSILKKVNELATDKGLQKQVDQYFDEEEPSPQTESDEHDSEEL